MKREGERAGDAGESRHIGAAEDFVNDGDRERPQGQRRRAQDLERLTEEPRPRCAPQDHRAETHGGEGREVKMSRAREVPRRDREVPRVEDWKFSARMNYGKGPPPPPPPPSDAHEL